MKTSYTCIAMAVAFCAAVCTPAAAADSCTYAGEVTEECVYPGRKEVINLGLEYVKGVSEVLLYEARMSKESDPRRRGIWAKYEQKAREQLPQLRAAWKAANTPAQTGERAYLYDDERDNTSWEWALNTAHNHFFNHVVVARVQGERLEGPEGFAKATVVSCKVERVINGDTTAGSELEFRVYPEEPTNGSAIGTALIICAHDIREGKVVEVDPYLYGYEHYYEAFMKVKADREKQQQTPQETPET